MTEIEESVRRCIDEEIARCRREERMRLPTVARLADLAGVSTVTVWKVLKHYKEEGILYSRRGGGIFIAPPEPASRQRPVSRPPAWQRVAGAVEADVIGGRYRASERLPRVGELAERYGAGYRTVKKALESLVARQLIRQYKRGYAVVSTRGRIIADSLVLIAQGHPRTERIFPETRRRLRYLEHACMNAGLRLNLVLYGWVDGKRRIFNRAAGLKFAREELDSILGFHVWTHGLDEATATEVVQRLAGYEKPVSILDTLGSSRLADAASYYRRVRLYKLWGDMQAGMAAGNYLRGMGHSSVAFISPFSDTVWSRARLSGLRRAFEDDASASVHCLCGSCDVSSIDGHRWTIEELRAVRDGIVTRGVSSRSSLEQLMGRALRRLIEEINERMKREIFSKAMRELLVAGGVLEQASAWVAVNDDVACECLDFARESAIGVPADVSLIGFDDSLASRVNGITSYNFNETAAIQATINHVVGHTAGPGTRTSVVDIQGRVTERDSVARMPSS
ncbi:MAG: GntR family transcriptional regulator [Chitinivibrionales bacterium]|nr:GntR family transcriptional regulator [Chitinivibrionales bacterium]